MRAEAQGNPPARIYLQPIAAPSVLGLYAFAGSTLIVAAKLAGLYGDSQTASYLFPFAVFEGVSGRAVLPVGKTGKAKKAPEVNAGAGEPGVKQGQ